MQTVAKKCFLKIQFVIWPTINRTFTKRSLKVKLELDVNTGVALLSQTLMWVVTQ